MSSGLSPWFYRVWHQLSIRGVGLLHTVLNENLLDEHLDDPLLRRIANLFDAHYENKRVDLSSVPPSIYSVLIDADSRWLFFPKSSGFDWLK